MSQLSKNLQGDIIKIKGKKIFINPFLYFLRLDQKTKNWFKETRQIPDSIIFENRVRFYSEVDWKSLTNNEKLIVNGTIEMFLKTLEIIKTFHPYLSLEELKIVESNLIISKKIPFEEWNKKYLKKKNRLILKEQNKLKRSDFLNIWKKWLYLKETQKLIVPMFVIIFLSFLIGFFAGFSKNSCNPYFETSRNQI